MTTVPASAAELRPLAVATAQVASVPGDLGANAARSAVLVNEAADLGARLLVLPELFLPGYDLATLAARPAATDLDAGALDDPRLAPLREATADTGVLALAGASVRDAGPGTRTISVLAVGGAGGSSDGAAVRRVYDKQHVCGDEADVFVPGDHGAVLDLDGWPLGLAVCYDGCFPEHARAAADAGALVYVAPVAYAAGSEHRRSLYYRARAVENGLYAVVSGLVGPCGDDTYSGGSEVVDAEGRVMAAVAVGAEGLAVATLDPDAQRTTRAAHTMHADHRADLGPVLRV